MAAKKKDPSLPPAMAAHPSVNATANASADATDSKIRATPAPSASAGASAAPDAKAALLVARVEKHRVLSKFDISVGEKKVTLERSHFPTAAAFEALKGAPAAAAVGTSAFFASIPVGGTVSGKAVTLKRHFGHGKEVYYSHGFEFSVGATTWKCADGTEGTFIVTRTA